MTKHQVSYKWIASLHFPRNFRNKPAELFNIWQKLWAFLRVSDFSDIRRIWQIACYVLSTYFDLVRIFCCKAFIMKFTNFQAQCRAYLDWMHKDKLSELASALEKDTWAAKDVSPETQTFLHDLLVRGNSDSGPQSNGFSQSDATNPRKYLPLYSLSWFVKICVN